MKNKLLLVISIVVMALGVALFIAASVLALTGKTLLSDIFFGVSSLLGIGALALMIYNLAISSKFASPEVEPNKPKVVVKIVDVKDVPKTKEEKLYEQYEGLYKQGLITKEDLDKKRAELLKK
jgi:hypothetical protein